MPYHISTRPLCSCKPRPSRFRLRLRYFFTWPLRVLRLWRQRCPWCNSKLLRSTMHGGPLSHQVGHARYCSHYHFFESDCRFKESVCDPASHRHVRDVCRTYVCVHDPYGNIPEEAKQTVDSLIYALHRMVLYERLYEEEMQTHRDEAMRLVIRSCEPLMDRLIGLDD